MLLICHVELLSRLVTVVVKWKSCQSSVAPSLSLSKINQKFSVLRGVKESNTCDLLPTESLVLLRSLEGKNSFNPQPRHSEEAALQSGAAPHLFRIYWNYSFDQYRTMSESNSFCQCVCLLFVCLLCWFFPVILQPVHSFMGPIHNSDTEDCNDSIKLRSFQIMYRLGPIRVV